MQAGLKRQGEVLRGETRPALEQADSNKQQQTEGVEKQRVVGEEGWRDG